MLWTNILWDDKNSNYVFAISEELVRVEEKIIHYFNSYSHIVEVEACMFHKITIIIIVNSLHTWCMKTDVSCKRITIFSHS